MKKTAIIIALTTLAANVFAGGGKEKPASVLSVGATPVPHAALLNLIAPDLAKAGITLKVVEFNDYVIPNEAVESGQLDANFFQHVPYQETFNKNKGYHLVSVGGVHVEPLALYSKKFKKAAELPAEASIAIPNDPTNEGRALLLLQAGGLIKLKADAGLTATPQDIAENPKRFKFKELEASLTPHVLGDVDAAVINGNYAIPAGLAAARDGLLVEGKDSPYVNIVTVKAGNEGDPRIKALTAALRSQKVKDYILKTYPNGDVVPAF